MDGLCLHGSFCVSKNRQPFRDFPGSSCRQFWLTAIENWENRPVSRPGTHLHVASADHLAVGDGDHHVSLRPSHDGELRSSPLEHVAFCLTCRGDVVPKVVSAFDHLESRRSATLSLWIGRRKLVPYTRIYFMPCSCAPFVSTAKPITRNFRWWRPPCLSASRIQDGDLLSSPRKEYGVLSDVPR